MEALRRSVGSPLIRCRDDFSSFMEVVTGVSLSSEQKALVRATSVPGVFVFRRPRGLRMSSVLEHLSGHASSMRTVPVVPEGVGRSGEFVVLEKALGVPRGALALRLGFPNHRIRRWRMRGEAELAGTTPSADSRECPPHVVATMRALVALKWAAPAVLHCMESRAAFADVLGRLRTCASFVGDRDPRDYASLGDGADET